MLSTSVATATFLSGLQDGYFLRNARDYLSVLGCVSQIMVKTKTIVFETIVSLFSGVKQQVLSYRSPSCNKTKPIPQIEGE